MSDEKPEVIQQARQAMRDGTAGPAGSPGTPPGPIGPRGADGPESAAVINSVPGTEEAQPPLTPEPSSTEKVAHTTRSDNIGKNWDGSELSDEQRAQQEEAQEFQTLADAARDYIEEESFDPETSEDDHDDRPDADRDFVYLPQAIATEFAIQPDSARDMVLMGQVKIDGNVLHHNRGYVRRAEIVDQWIQVVSDVKSVRFRYSPE